MFEWHTTGVPEEAFAYCMIITRSPCNNQVYCYEAVHLNFYTPGYSKIPLTGWFYEEGGPDDDCYRHIDRKILAWARLPRGEVVEEFLKQLQSTERCVDKYSEAWKKLV